MYEKVSIETFMSYIKLFFYQQIYDVILLRWKGFSILISNFWDNLYIISCGILFQF